MAYKIKDFSRIIGVEPHNLRFYEEKGLPGAERDESGYRVYDIYNAYDVNRFLAFRAMGFTVQESAEVLKGIEPLSLVEKLEDKENVEFVLNAVPKEYEGLGGTELAISESQERMAVVVAAEDAEAFLGLAAEENLQACVVAKVKEEPRLTMYWNGKAIVDISRAFLNANGAPKHTVITPAASRPVSELRVKAPDGSGGLLPPRPVRAL